MMKVKLTPEVKAALAKKKPVVALESTIIAHGMPYPQNLDMARDVEKVIRSEGAVPATIAVVDGQLRAGLTDKELERFAKEGPGILKVSTRDLPFVVAKKMNGATTVASTMRIATMAGIHVFATGGIGGVHRGAEKTFDVSADLIEFAKSNVAVVTAGAKSILDLALTLEVLETQGVPVIGFGADEFPAFFSRQSGHQLTLRADTAKEVAAMMKAKWAIGLNGGMVIANPIPTEYEIPSAQIAPQIERAVAEAKAKGILGKDVTPFLLKRINEITEGRSLASNLQLVLHNARIAAQIAKEFANQQPARRRSR
jgi:pseudouridine-5'-phosphate glycosidase